LVAHNAIQEQYAQHAHPAKKPQIVGADTKQVAQKPAPQPLAPDPQIHNTLLAAVNMLSQPVLAQFKQIPPPQQYPHAASVQPCTHEVAHTTGEIIQVPALI
jgi:hypothetical protein